MLAGRAKAIRYPDAALFVIPNAAKRGILGAMPAAQRAPIYGYMLTNRVRTLYVGVTNDLERRMYEHKHKLVPGFTSRYNVTWLAYYEQTPDVASAIAKEKQIKGWRRSKKVELIESSRTRDGRTCRWSGYPTPGRGLRFLAALGIHHEGCDPHHRG